MRRVHGLLAALTLLGACGQPEQAVEAPAQHYTGQMTIQRAAAPDYKTVSAVLTSRDVGDARARIGGTLTRLMVREGEQVRRGQVVAIISDQRLALEAQAGSAGIAAAEASAERARADQARFTAGGLRDGKAVTGPDELAGVAVAAHPHGRGNRHRSCCPATRRDLATDRSSTGKSVVRSRCCCRTAFHESTRWS